MAPPTDEPGVNPLDLRTALRRIIALDTDAGLDEAKAIAISALVDLEDLDQRIDLYEPHWLAPHAFLQVNNHSERTLVVAAVTLHTITPPS